MAFSLVEVSIAIGITAFGVVSLIGLLGSVMATSRQAKDDTVLSDIAKTVSTQLRARPFSAPSSGTDNSLATLSMAGEEARTSYFKIDGTPTNQPEESLFVCKVTLTPQPQFNTVTTNEVNLYEAKIEFSWPYPQRTSRKTFYINLARYDR